MIKSGVVDQASSQSMPGRGGAGQMPRYQGSTGFRPPVLRQSAPHPKRRLVLVPIEGWFALGLLAIAVYSVVFSIIDAGWVGHTSVLLISAPIGLLAGFVVAKMRRLPQLGLHLLACLGGYWLALWLTSSIALQIPWVTLLGSLRAVITSGLAASTATSNEMVFLFYLCFLSFFLGYLGSWLIYRAHLPWLVALAYCSIMLVNLNYAKQDFIYLVFILLAALILLIARIQLAMQLELWKSEGLYTDRPWLRSITGRCMQIACGLTLCIMLGSLLFPVFNQPGSGVSFWNSLDNAMSNFSHGNLSLQDPGSLLLPYQTPTNFFGDQLTVSGSVSLPNGEVLDYTSTAAPQYLEGLTYNHFDGRNWTTTTPNTNWSYAAGIQQPVDSESGSYEQATTTVTVVQPIAGTKAYIFAPPQPTTFDVPTVVYGNGVATAWTQQGQLTRGEHYTVASNVPKANLASLTHVALPIQPAGWENDPNFAFLEAYYQHVPDLPSTILKTAEQWTASAHNAYDAMQALEAHLSDPGVFTYSVTNPTAPQNVDLVSWLLQTRRGYCTHYATAMVVMARQLGMPARLVSGFSQGHFDVHRNLWVVKGDDAHSWVQVYFPNQGWINFDPTPGFSLNLFRNNGNSVSPQPKPGVHPTVTPGSTTKPKPNLQHPTTSDTTQTVASAKSASVLPVLIDFSFVLLFCSILFLLFSLCSYWWRNLYKDSSFISGTYWRVCRVASWAGIKPKTWQTPYEYSQTLSQKMPQAVGPLHHLTDLFVRERWGAPYAAPHPREHQAIERHWPYLRRSLLGLFVRRFRKY